MDAYKNFAVSKVATAPSPATSGTSLTVESGNGTYFSEGANAVVCPDGEQPTWSNAEIVRVTAISTDTLTITRAQEGTTARSVVVGDVIYQGITDKWLDDLLNGQFIVDATGKTIPVDADTMPLIDSADSNKLKKLTWANLKATIKTYYDSVTATLTNKTLTNPTINFTDKAPTYNVKCRAYRSGLQENILNDTATKIQLNAEDYDDGNDFDSTTNYRFVAPVAGTYDIWAQVTWVNAVDGTRHYCYLLKNGSAEIANNILAPGATTFMTQMVHFRGPLSTNDYVELWVKTISGISTEDIYQYSPYTFMEIMLVST